MTAKPYDASTKRILIVEDEQPLRDLYVQLLKAEGYQVDQAKDGNEAYDALYKGGYDLVLLDIILPKLDGLQVLEKLQKVSQPEKPNKTIVLLTNLVQDLVIAKALTYGVRGYMVKSDYTPDTLLAEIKSYLNK